MGESPRKVLAARLEEARPGVPVFRSVPSDLPNVTGPVLWLRTEQWAPHSGESFLRVELTALLVSGLQDVASADDELDDALLGVLQAVGDVPGVTWREASRAVVADRYHCFEIPLEFYVEKKDVR